MITESDYDCNGNLTRTWDANIMNLAEASNSHDSELLVVVGAA